MGYFVILPKTFFFSKHPNKAEFNDMDDSEVLRRDFSGLRTSVVSMTSTASTTSMTSTASFHQKIYWFWWLDHSWHHNDQYLTLFVEWIIKNPIFHWYLIPFSIGGCWGQHMLLFWKLVDETQMYKTPEPTRHHNSIKLLILLPLRANLLCILHYETPCMFLTNMVFLYSFFFQENGTS